MKQKINDILFNICVIILKSNEVKNSMGMEKRGLERAIDWFHNNDLECGMLLNVCLSKRKKDRWIDGWMFIIYNHL